MFNSKLIVDYMVCFFYHLLAAISCYYFTSFSFVVRILVGGSFGLLVIFVWQKHLKCVGSRDKVFADWLISDSLFDRFSDNFLYTKASILLFNLFYMLHFMTILLWYDILPMISNFVTSLWTDSVVEAEETTKQSQGSIAVSKKEYMDFTGLLKKHALNLSYLAGVGAVSGGFFILIQKSRKIHPDH